MKIIAPLALAALVVDTAIGFVAPKRTAHRATSSLNGSLEKYAEELKATANALVRPGRGLLACDESTGTVGSRLESIGMENVEENRRDVRSVESLIFRGHGA